MDIKSRTAFGVTYDTYELAQKAIENQKTCEHQWQYAVTQSYSKLCETLKKFQEINETPPQGSVSDFVEKASAKEKKFRTVNGVVYETYEIAKKAASSRSIAGEILRQCANANPTDLQDALQKVKALNQEVPEGAISDYIDKISEIEISTRTVNAVLYDTFELAEKARANRRDGGKLVQACDTTANIDIRWVLQRLQQINHLDPIGSVSDYVDEILSKFFDRKDTNNFTFRGLIFQSIIERQEVECDFVILVTKHMSNAPTSQSLARLRSELETIPSTSPLYRLISSYIQEVEQALQIQEEKEQVRLEEEKKRLSAVRRYRLKSLAEICFGTIFLYTLINVPLIVIGENPCTFPAIVDIVAGSIDFSENVHLLGYPALLLIHIGFGIGIIKEMLKSVKTMFEGGVNQSEVCGYIAWTCIAIIAISMIGGAFYHCERYVYWWLVASIIGYICVDSHK